jgi:hypothetical protein|nr:hypothetical protein [uncultured Acetatifactor sp.]
MELLKKHLAKSPAFAIIQVGLFETTYIASGMEAQRARSLIPGDRRADEEDQ